MREPAECYVTSRVPRTLYNEIEAECARTFDATGVKVTMSSMVRALLTQALKPKKRRK
jgi:hypothetical protein